MRQTAVLITLALALVACGETLDPDNPDHRKTIVLDVTGMS